MGLLDFEDSLLGENPTLKPNALIHLKSYRYRSVDKSYLSKYILNPYWTWAAQFMPSWLAPNVITLIGFACICVNILCILIYIPDLTSQAPAWVYISFALGLWTYQTMDNIDGKQARRTGTSSPLGELFDHGLDSLNCALGGLVQSACMGLGPSEAAAFTIFSTCLAMYLSTWETFHTHVLYLGVVNGPTEGIVIAIAVMLFTAVAGPQVWQQPAVSVSPLLGALVGDTMLLKEFWVIALGASVVLAHVPFCVYHVYCAARDGETRDSFKETLWQLVPIASMSTAVWFWTTGPYSILLRDNHLVLFTVTMSFVFGRVTTSIILAHLTKQEFPYWSLPMLPLFWGAFLFDILPRLGLQLSESFELVYLWGYCLFSMAYFLEYATKVIRTLCEFLEINCFTIPNAVTIGKIV
ncbi:cholinephosphotransferase 1 [Trichomonascus vanleenenianus]|uniref:cholinephosphotransferase 1 n=1 Tax=Trichomonascus vanleenenianus TaxID=2268995 RepID=UPI003ECBA13B